MILRVWAMVKRYLVLHLRSVARLFEILFWPTVELLVWGFLSVFLIKSGGENSILIMLLSSVIFWDVLYRSQQSVSLSFMEEIWSRNLLNLLISPLGIGEWVLASFIYSFLKTGFIIALMSLFAWALYDYSVFRLGFALIPFLGSLFLLGWALGVFTAGLIILWGHAAEGLIWGIPFLIQPFSAIFYPLSTYPKWLQPFCAMLPSTQIMEGMRQVIHTGEFSWGAFLPALLLNAVYFLLAAWFFQRMFQRGRKSGKIIRLTD